MAWKELRFPLGDMNPEQVEHTLEALGALAITLEDAADDALLEPAPGEQPIWPHSRVRALFDVTADTEGVVGALQALTGDTAAFDPAIVRIEDQEWETAWRQDFHAMPFGANLWVCPTDETIAPANAAVIYLDPGLAFGTGTHPTTALCLEWLGNASLADKQVVDYGCGSGILAIAAAKLRAEKVHAVDYDPQALTATRDNATANHCANDIATYTPGNFPALKADVLVANILARPLAELAELFAHTVKPGGDIALSGILREQCDELTSIYAQWFDMKTPTLNDDWALLVGQRRGNP